jgi:cytochrome c6
MKNILAITVATISFCALIAGGAIAVEKAEKKESNKISGEAQFKEHCAVCHPDGGNIINPAKTLHKKDLDANGINKPADIIAKMRNPGPGMTQFDKKAIPDKEAQTIADYILKSLK